MATRRVDSSGYLLEDPAGSSYERFSNSDVDLDDRGDVATPLSHDLGENFRVAIRVRPPVQRELEGPRPFINVVRIPTDNSITLCDVDADDGHGSVYATQSYTFDVVYAPEARQRDVYDRSAHPAVMSALQGYNATLMAYGQTGTGKTYTMEGFTNDEHRGIIPNATEAVFAFIDRNRTNPNVQFKVRASYLQIYKEVVSDLLKATPTAAQKTAALTIRQSKNRTYVDGLSEWMVTNPEDIYGLMERGCSVRATSATRMSELSSRSHAIFQIVVEVFEGNPEAPQTYKVGKLNIVDLAGSEKVRATGVTGQRLEEAKKINWSLHQLGNVISALTDPARRDHIPYRNSKLTQLLTDSLGGNCKTTLIACISPAFESYAESLSTLKFANRAKNIKNDAVVNEEAEQGALIAKYERELQRLRTQLQAAGGAGPGSAGSGGRGVDRGIADSDRRRVEAARDSALEQLEARGRMYDEEKRQKQALESRLEELERQLLSNGVVGGDMDGTGRGSTSVAQREDIAQVDRYKQLLLKQRDIMLNLTQRLNERDEAIIKLQEEIDAYDEHIAGLEAQLEDSSSKTGAGQPALRLPMAEAQRHIAACAVTGRSGETRYRAEGRRGSEGILLSAEDKMVELLSTHGPPPAASAERNGSADPAKQRVLEQSLASRVEDIATGLVRERCGRLLEELGTARSQLAAAQHELRTCDAAVEVGRSSNLAMQSQRVKEYAAEESDHLRRSLNSQIEHLTAQLAAERQERTSVASDIARVSVQLRRLRDVVDPSRSRELDALWSDVCTVEDRVRKEAASTVERLSNVGASSSPRGASSHGPSSMGSSGDGAIRQLEATLDTVKRQKEALREELQAQQGEQSERVRQLEGGLAERDRKEAALRRQLQAHEKDRAALKKILEQRVKVKLDNIGNALRTGAEPKMVDAELTSLQNLVNASIAAMNTDQQQQQQQPTA